MNLTEEQLAEITNFAMLQFLPYEIAFILQIDPNEFQTQISTHDSEINKAYFRGQLIAEAEVRKAILTMAKQGSSPAQKEFINLVKQRKQNKNAPKSF